MCSILPPAQSLIAYLTKQKWYHALTKSCRCAHMQTPTHLCTSRNKHNCNNTMCYPQTEVLQALERARRACGPSNSFVYYENWEKRSSERTVQDILRFWTRPDQDGSLRCCLPEDFVAMESKISTISYYSHGTGHPQKRTKEERKASRESRKEFDDALIQQIFQVTGKHANVFF